MYTEGGNARKRNRRERIHFGKFKCFAVTFFPVLILFLFPTRYGHMRKPIASKYRYFDDSPKFEIPGPFAVKKIKCFIVPGPLCEMPKGTNFFVPELRKSDLTLLSMVRSDTEHI